MHEAICPLTVQWNTKRNDEEKRFDELAEKFKKLEAHVANYAPRRMD